MENIIINVNLKGSLTGPQKHNQQIPYSHKEVHTKGKKTYIKTINTTITHTPRIPKECVKKIKVEAYQIKNYFDSLKSQKKYRHITKMSDKQKLNYYAQTFNEGYGVTFEIIK